MEVSNHTQAIIILKTLAKLMRENQESMNNPFTLEDARDLENVAQYLEDNR